MSRIMPLVCEFLLLLLLLMMMMMMMMMMILSLQLSFWLRFEGLS